jgi:hypothetical protein
MFAPFDITLGWETLAVTVGDFVWTERGWIKS